MDGELASHELYPLPLLEPQTFPELMPHDDFSFRDRLNQRVARRFGQVGYFSTTAHHNDGSFHFGPFGFHRQSRQKVPNGQNARPRQPMDVVLRHGCFRVILLMPLPQILLGRQNRQIEAQLERGFAHFIFQLRQSTFQCFFLFGQRLGRADVVGFQRAVNRQHRADRDRDSQGRQQERLLASGNFPAGHIQNRHRCDSSIDSRSFFLKHHCRIRCRSRKNRHPATKQTDQSSQYHRKQQTQQHRGPVKRRQSSGIVR